MSTIILHPTAATGEPPTRRPAHPETVSPGPSSHPTSLPARAAAVVALVAATLLIHGYHPLAEDGGLYIAGVEYTLNPSLFPHDTAFVTAHLSYSIFAPLVAGIVRTTHLPLDWVVLLAYLASVTLTFLAARQILRRCVSGFPAQLVGMALLAVWWTLPIAGTSLMLMDPYVTARSFSTPLSLLAVAFALDEWPTTPWMAHSRGGFMRHRWGSATACGCTLLLAALFHPLMAGYALALLLMVKLSRLSRRNLAYALAAIAVLVVGAVVQGSSATDSPAAIAAAMTRYYWFLSCWHWYEDCGLLGPPVIFWLLLRTQRNRLNNAAAHLLRAAITLGCLATVVALIFAHQDSRTHEIARLQPLRAFLPLYAIMALLLGTSLSKLVLEQAGVMARSKAIAAAVLVALAAISFTVQRDLFAASPHIEIPGRESQHANPWVQAFVWAGSHTPPGAVFALDARYINQNGEDAQNFRAWAERSVLPDFSKDGGEAAITPALAGLWLQSANAQRSLSSEDDTQRDPRILPLGATWMLVHSAAATHHPCPYDNGTVKVCQLIP